MTKVLLQSWNIGLQKVSLTKLQMEKLAIPLERAKKNTDSLIAGNVIALEIEDMAVAIDFEKKATKIGVNCIIE